MLRALKGVHLAFTGILSERRSEAVRAAKRAGAIIHSGPSAKTTVVVRGTAEPAAGGRADARAQADGDQAAARERAPDHAAQRNAVLAPGEALSNARPTFEVRSRTFDVRRLLTSYFGLAASSVRRYRKRSYNQSASSASFGGHQGRLSGDPRFAHSVRPGGPLAVRVRRRLRESSEDRRMSSR